MKTFFSYFLLLIIVHLNATTYNVGPSRMYTSPNALYQANVLGDGDIIEIDFATYSGNACLANWSRNNLVIRGIGGKPHMIANNQNIQGKGIWIITGNNISIENIEFSGATVPDQNGAGIRSEGIDLTIRSCYFHNNENGILTNNPNTGHIIIEYSEFAYNGFGDGYTHNLYIGKVNKLTFKYNYSHHCNIGHNLKSRANENIILYNRIMDESNGNSSRLIDLPNGGFSIVMGNLIMQGNSAVNNNMVGYGLEGLTNSVAELYFINNTLVNKRTASCKFIQLQSGTNVAQIINNIFAGTGTVLDGTSSLMSNNLTQTNIALVQFVDEPNYNYALNATSPAIDIGTNVATVNGYSLVPNQLYSHPVNFLNRTTIGTIDIGAYEYSSALSTESFANQDIIIYPNPASTSLTIENYSLIDILKLIDSTGKIIKEFKPTTSNFNIESLASGVYTLSILTNKSYISRKIIKL